MKPRFAKEICDTTIKRPENEKWANDEFSPVENSLEFIENFDYWQGLRSVIEAIEKSGYQVSITKDGKEYNQ